MTTTGACTLRLLADPVRFGVVRRLVGVYVRLWGWGELEDAAVMCVTEMLANVHRHVESPRCELTLQALPDGVLAGVSDSSPAAPVVGQPDWEAEGGRGMWLLAAIADQWGVCPDLDGHGKQVWVTLKAAS
jgi:Histidine kinase-like ATPase domain